MVLTQYGRIEVDPMRIPTAAPIRIDGEDTFAQRLQYVTADRQEAPTHRQPAAAARPTTPPATPRAADPAPPVESEAPVAARPDDPALACVPAVALAPAAANCAQGTRAPAPELPDTGHAATDLRAAAGAGAAAAMPTGPAVPSNSAGNDVVAAVGGVAAATPARPVATASSSDGRTALSGTAARQQAASRLPAVLASYRSLGKQSVLLVEQARDSVFKQIVVRLDKNGGEMKVRLEPPELGELDLHLVVANGGDLRLSIGTERQDLAQLLDRDLAALKQTLQASGLNVTHAEVHTRSDASARQQQRADQGFAHASAGADEPAPQLQRLGGYISAQGLDYWV